MAIDPNPPPSSVESGVGAIENELPTYRAISALAVVSFLLGLLSLLCFADFSFLAAAAAAVVIGLLAERKIRRYPDILTGRGFAQAGVALGIACGLASLTINQVQSFLRQRQATAFAKSYVAKQVRGGSVAEALYFRLPPELRKETTPEQALEVMKQQARDPMMMHQQVGPIERMQQRLASDPAETVEVVGVENHGIMDLNVFANVLLRFRGPGKANPPEEFGLLALKSKAGKNDWWIDTIFFPYTPRTYKPTPQPIDDGHGHAH